MDYKPDVKTIAVKQAGGGITIVRLVENEYLPDPDNPGQRMLYRHRDITNEFVEYTIARYVNDGHWVGDKAPVGWRFVPNDFMEENMDRTFRDAWKDDGGNKPGVDMTKARNIHRERLRQHRTSLLEDLDNEYMQADEKGNTQEKAKIAAKKQKLRDITDHPDIEKAKTPEQLKKVWPFDNL